MLSVYINEVVKTKSTLAKRIADFFGDVMESLKALINKGDTYSRFAKEINDNIDTAKQMYIYNRDINSNILIGRKGIEHGLRRNSDIIAYVEQYLGDYLENSVKINELILQDENAASAYLLLGLGIDNEDIQYPVYFVINQFKDGTTELERMDVLYSVNAQKIESAVKTAKGNVNKDISFSDSLISVSDLLDIVNEIYSDILPESVAKSTEMKDEIVLFFHSKK